MVPGCICWKFTWMKTIVCWTFKDKKTLSQSLVSLIKRKWTFSPFRLLPTDPYPVKTREKSSGGHCCWIAVVLPGKRGVIFHWWLTLHHDPQLWQTARHVFITGSTITKLAGVINWIRGEVDWVINTSRWQLVTETRVWQHQSTVCAGWVVGLFRAKGDEHTRRRKDIIQRGSKGDTVCFPKDRTHKRPAHWPLTAVGYLIGCRVCLEEGHIQYEDASGFSLGQWCPLS